jgi:hypothetical protein
MYKNTELLYKYARGFFPEGCRSLHLPARGIFVIGAIISRFSASPEK